MEVGIVIAIIKAQGHNFSSEFGVTIYFRRARYIVLIKKPNKNLLILKLFGPCFIAINNVSVSICQLATYFLHSGNTDADC